MRSLPSMALLNYPFMSCWPAMLLRYFPNDLQEVSAAHVITGITFDFTFQIHGISAVRSLYFKLFTASVLITFLSPHTARSGNLHVPFSYQELWCPVYCYGWFCRFSLVGSTMWSPYFHDILYGFIIIIIVIIIIKFTCLVGTLALSFTFLCCLFYIVSQVNLNYGTPVFS